MKLLRGLGVGAAACLVAGLGYAVYIIKKDPELKERVQHTLQTAQQAIMVHTEAAQERAAYEASQAEEALKKAQTWAVSEWKKVDK